MSGGASVFQSSRRPVARSRRYRVRGCCPARRERSSAISGPANEGVTRVSSSYGPWGSAAVGRVDDVVRRALSAGDEPSVGRHHVAQPLVADRPRWSSATSWRTTHVPPLVVDVEQDRCHPGRRFPPVEHPASWQGYGITAPVGDEPVGVRPVLDDQSPLLIRRKRKARPFRAESHRRRPSDAETS